MAFILLIKKKKGKATIKKHHYRVKPALVWTVLPAQIWNIHDMYKKYMSFYEVQEGERELKNMLEMFGQLIEVKKDKGVLCKLK